LEGEKAKSENMKHNAMHTKEEERERARRGCEVREQQNNTLEKAFNHQTSE
jgi:hypothetical protein